MRADNTAALGRAPAWEQGSGSSCGYREFHSKPGEEIGGKKTLREALPVPTAVLWLNPHTPWVWNKCIQVLRSTSLQGWRVL